MTLLLFIVFASLFNLYNLQILTLDTNLTAVFLNTQETNLGITPISLTEGNFADLSTLTIKGSFILLYVEPVSSEINYQIIWEVNDVPTLFPRDSLVFLMGSDSAPIVNFEMNFVRSGSNVILISGTLLKGGGINEGDILPQVSNYKAGVTVGSLPITFTLSAFSPEQGDNPNIQIDSVISYVTPNV